MSERDPYAMITKMRCLWGIDQQALTVADFDNFDDCLTALEAALRDRDRRILAMSQAIDWVCSEYIECPPNRGAMENGIRVWLGHLKAIKEGKPSHVRYK